jgi:ribosome-binding factor A
MTNFSRADRVSQLIQRELSEILQKETKDPRLKMTTITGVKLSKDLKNAKIYFSVADRDQQDVLKGFQSAHGHIKRTLAGRLELRYMPELRFYYDESFDYGERIEKLLKSVANAYETDGSDHNPVGSE